MSGLESEFPGIQARNEDATTPEGRAAVQALGFQTHGLVIRSADGKVLWKQPDHEARVEAARAEISRLRKS